MAVKLLTELETADRLGVRPATLQAWRARGTGPRLPFVKVGRLVRYREPDVDRVIEDNVHGDAQDAA
jgi:hypothetical protein